MTKDEALKLAYDVLKNIAENATTPYYDDWCGAEAEEVLPAIKEALARQDSTCNNMLHAQGKALPRTCKQCGLGPCVKLAQPKQALDKLFEVENELGLHYDEKPAQPEQEPMAINQYRVPYCADWYDGIPDHHDGHGPYEVRTLYTTPPQRTWIGLTELELVDLWFKESLDWLEFARVHEAKLKEKNT